MLTEVICIRLIRFLGDVFYTALPHGICKSGVKGLFYSANRGILKIMESETKKELPSVRNIALFTALVVGTTALWGILSYFAEQRANDRYLTELVGKHDEDIKLKVGKDNQQDVAI